VHRTQPGLRGFARQLSGAVAEKEPDRLDRRDGAGREGRELPYPRSGDAAAEAREAEHGAGVVEWSGDRSGDRWWPGCSSRVPGSQRALRTRLGVLPARSGAGADAGDPYTTELECTEKDTTEKMDDQRCLVGNGGARADRADDPRHGRSPNLVLESVPHVLGL